MSPQFLARVRHLFNYDNTNGFLLWRSPKGTARIGRRAGYKNKTTGYRKITIDGKLYAEHRVIWLLVTGQWPELEIDHINHIRDDNRIANLREVSRLANAKHRKRPGSVRKYGYGKWHAHIQRNFVSFDLGLHDTEAAAHEAIAAFIRQEHRSAHHPE